MTESDGVCVNAGRQTGVSVVLLRMRVVGGKDFTPFDWEAVKKSHHRHLPQLDQPGAIYFVTFRLADSLP